MPQDIVIATRTPHLGTMFLEMDGLPLLVLLGMTLFFWGVVITLLILVLREK